MQGKRHWETFVQFDATFSLSASPQIVHVPTELGTDDEPNRIFGRLRYVI